jgi:hypothetical protein
MYFAPIEELVKEISLRCKGSPTRQKYMQYFLDGLRDDAKKLSTSMDNADLISIWHEYTLTLSRPFRGLIRESLSRELGTSFSHAKCLYDNLNRFLQASYISEEEVEKRHEKIRTSKQNGPNAIFEAYNLKSLTPVMQSTSDVSNGILLVIEDLRERGELMERVRNATAHGHGHTMLQCDKKGFFLSPEYLKGWKGYENTRFSVNNLSGYLQRFYFSKVAECLEMVSEDAEILRERTKNDVLLAHVAGHKAMIGWNLRFWSKGFAPMMALVLTAIPIADSLQYIPVRKHSDEQTRRQATELCNFQREVRRTDAQLEEVLGKIKRLERDSPTMLSYTNRPASFDVNDVSNRIERLKKVADAFSGSAQNP